MNPSQDLLHFLRSSPDSVLILSQDKGKIVWADDVFLERWGFSKGALFDTSLIRMPSVSRQARHGLIRLYVKARRGDEDKKGFVFHYLDANNQVKKALSRASRVEIDNRTYILFTFKDLPPRKWVCVDYMALESWEAQQDLGYEPYLEFRPNLPILPPAESADRRPFLEKIASQMCVVRANQAAVNLYSSKNESLIGRTFASFFHNQEDMLRFMDMLSVVGQMKAETVVNASGGKAVDIEMNCRVQFEADDSIAVLYCAQRNLFKIRYYESLIGGNRIENDFVFQQPHIGLAFLMASRPIVCPSAPLSSDQLDGIMEKILVTRANQAMLELQKTDSASFLMKPMTILFESREEARRILKELFSRRECSSDTPHHASSFRPIIDESSRLTGVMVARGQRWK